MTTEDLKIFEEILIEHGVKKWFLFVQTEEGQFTSYQLGDKRDRGRVPPPPGEST